MAVEEGEDGDEVDTGQNKPKLSHKKWRRLLQKEKRRQKRQQEAEIKKQLQKQEKWRYENDPIYRAKQEAKEKAAEKRLQQEILESKRQEQLWLEREAISQVAFRKMKEKEEKREKERIEQELRIKEEWEDEQRSKKEKEEKKKHEIQEKENAVFRELEKTPQNAQNASNDGQWHNPLAPHSTHSQNYGTEQDTVNCSFYLKTGACRFGERCSRVHPRLPSSVTLLIPYMYQDIRLSQTMLDEADHDIGLEYDDEESNERYKDFFNDVLPEFEKAGNVVQFKVCCNYEHHLRGNVYVQFTSEQECAQAYAAFNGRWYAGRQLSCEYSPVTKWRSAICGLFTRGRCPRGKNCNFLHVYRNPGNAFRYMDRDDSSPGRTPHSDRGSERSSRDWRRDVRERSYGGNSERRRERERSQNGSSVRYSRERDYERDRFLRDRDHKRDRECDEGRHGRDRFGRDRGGDRDRDRNRDRDRDRDLDKNRDELVKNRDERDKERDKDRHDKFDKKRKNTDQHCDRDSFKLTKKRCPEHCDDGSLSFGGESENTLNKSQDVCSNFDDETGAEKTKIRKQDDTKSVTNSVDSDHSDRPSSRHRKHRSTHKKTRKKHKKHKHRKRKSGSDDDSRRESDQTNTEIKDTTDEVDIVH